MEPLSSRPGRRVQKELSMKQPLVSVVLPTYNGEKYIHGTIEAILGQSYENLELIVCDDCSSDRTAEIVKSFSDSRIRFLSFPENICVPGNLNRGLKQARGEFVCYTHQDDLFLPDKVKKQLEKFYEDPSLGAVFCRKTDMDENSNEMKGGFNPSEMSVHTREEVILYFLTAGCFVCAPTVMIKRAVFDEVGYFDEKYQIAYDLDMWFRILKKNYSISNLQEVLYKYRIHPDNLSTKYTEIGAYEAMDVFIHAFNEFEIDDMVNGLKESCRTDFDRICMYSLKCIEIAVSLKKSPEFLFTDLLALGFAEKALKINNNLLSAYFFVKSLHTAKGNTEQAEHYQRLFQNKCRNYNNSFQKLEKALISKNLEQENKLVRHIISFGPSDPEIIKDLSNIYMKVGSHKQAEKFSSLV